MRYKAPRGTNDITPEESWKWQALEEKFRRACRLSGFEEIRTPAFEETELFTRSIGEVTDIVSKEMYTFTDRGDRSLTLRPEGTAPVVRAWVERNIGAAGLPSRMFYIASIFRYERPQAGRYRQHHQFGVEAIGSGDASLDAEVIGLAARFLTEAGAAPFTLKINSIGTVEARKQYVEALKQSVEPYLQDLCGSCQTRYEKNPLRMLDCKVEKCRELTADVPDILDYLDEESEAHFAQVRECLDRLGLAYVVDKRLVRGFDYYTKTAFEIVADGLGAQDAVCGGGRYDNLVEELGGSPTPAVGFGMGIERLLMVLEARGAGMGERPHADVFVVRVGDRAQAEGLAVAESLRAVGLAAELDYGARSLKAQMKRANKSGARLALILGDDELDQGQITARDLLAQQQWRLPLTNCAEMIQDYLATSESATMEQIQGVQESGAGRQQHNRGRTT